MREEIGDRAGMAESLHNIGIVHGNRGEWNEALRSLKQSQMIRNEMGDKLGQAETHWELGILYRKKGNLVEAELSMSQAVAIFQELKSWQFETASGQLERLGNE